ncbi:MAG: Lar family restriction alleviation protein [archaeon]
MNAEQLFPTGTEAEVCIDIARRQAMGAKKYGTTVKENPLPLKEWLQHAYEEALDQAIYLKRAIAEIEDPVKLDSYPDSVPLKPCPFCGGKFHPQHPKMCGQLKFQSQPVLEQLHAGGWRVICYGCGISTWDNLGYSKDQAIAAWDTRTVVNPHTIQQPVANVEEMICECVPGGNSCDPQTVADDIRQYFKRNPIKGTGD